MTTEPTTEICRISQARLTNVLDFGSQPLGNGFLSLNEFSSEYFYRLQLGFSEESMMLQLLKQPEPEQMFHENYAFFSSTSIAMAKHFQEFAESVMASGFLRDDPFVVELGCNDGIMLKHFASRGIRHLGIEPALNVAKVANENGVRTISEFFSEEIAERLLENEGAADVIMAANVMCHIPDFRGVIKGFKTLLKKTGVVIFEDPYLGDVVSKTSYDQIYDEHVFLFSALSIQYAFGLEGMELIDVQPQTTHGGSMRYVLAHRGAHVARPSVSLLIEQEKTQGLDKYETFFMFREAVEQSKKDLRELLERFKDEGMRVAGYGATSKSTTILNYCGIGPDVVEYISDTTPIKQGKYSPGMHIPIKPYEFFLNDPPDIAILFAWNHAQEIMAKEKAFISQGGRFITHVPHVGYL